MVVYVKKAERSVYLADDGYVYRRRFGPRIGRVAKFGRSGWLADRFTDGTLTRMEKRVFPSRQQALRWLLEKADGI